MLNIPAGWKLVPERATKAMQDAWDSAPFNEDTDIEFHGAYRAMLAAAPSPLSAAPASAQEEAEGERQAFEAWAKRKKMPLARIGQQYDDFWVDHAWNGWQARARLSAPAAGDALDAARYRWLRDNIQEDHSLPGSFWLSDTGGESWDKTIDAAMAYQRQQGEAA